MTKLMKRSLMTAAAIAVVSVFAADDANAAANFSSIASNISGSIASLPSLLSGLAYMFGLLLAVLGIMKIKDHVENPGQTPLKDGAIRLLAGGALFALPIVTTAMQTTTGTANTAASQATLNAITFTG